MTALCWTIARGDLRSDLGRVDADQWQLHLAKFVMSLAAELICQRGVGPAPVLCGAILLDRLEPAFDQLPDRLVFRVKPVIEAKI